jgi:hypothetical protein
MSDHEAFEATGDPAWLFGAKRRTPLQDFGVTLDDGAGNDIQVMDWSDKAARFVFDWPRIERIAADQGNTSRYRAQTLIAARDDGRRIAAIMG